MRIETPRDRNGSFEPQIVPKRRSRFAGFDEKIIALYARGVSVRDIQAHLGELYGVEHIWFGDDVFALNRHWTEQFANAMQQQNCVLPFKVQSRADLMSAGTVEALARAGCSEVWMGVESGSQKVLDAMLLL